MYDGETVFRPPFFKKEDDFMYIVIGLGNPGREYLKTPHNMGFMAVELLAEKYGAEFNKKGFKGIYGEKTIDGEKVMFLKPQTYMNLSGECVREAVSYFKVDLKNIIVVYDDIDIAIGATRVRANGSAGTHNGMRNIVKELGSTDFARVRIGTKPEVNIPLIDYVLSDIRKEEEPRYKESVNRAVSACDDFIHKVTIDDIMCKYNGLA